MELQKLTIQLPATFKDIGISTIELTYQIFGKPLHEAPIILVNHALTGNSQVAGTSGWWKAIVGTKKAINLEKYTVIAFNIPWNGYQLEEVELPVQHQLLSTKKVAEIFWAGLDQLNVPVLHAIIGGSIGGSIGWEMAFLRPHAIHHLIPIACSLKASDWLIANVLVQEHILNHSTSPIEDARKHAMLLYRTPASLTEKFNLQYKKEEQQYAVESWLEYHGKTLKNRFSLNAYKVINHLLKTIGQEIRESDIVKFSQASNIKIHMIAINSDYMFPREEQLLIFETLSRYKSSIKYSEIQSIHGHDAFLIEYKQLETILNQVL
ncbi:MAG: alpha/beta fold hydrolase [Chitinophagales bacterium]|nr:alpha/beta fold hydrolase [Chitinophagales bacterium]